MQWPGSEFFPGAPDAAGDAAAPPRGCGHPLHPAFLACVRERPCGSRLARKGPLSLCSLTLFFSSILDLGLLVLFFLISMRLFSTSSSNKLLIVVCYPLPSSHTRKYDLYNTIIELICFFFNCLRCLNNAYWIGYSRTFNVVNHTYAEAFLALLLMSMANYTFSFLSV